MWGSPYFLEECLELRHEIIQPRLDVLDVLQDRELVCIWGWLTCHSFILFIYILTALWDLLLAALSRPHSQ